MFCHNKTTTILGDAIFGPTSYRRDNWTCEAGVSSCSFQSYIFGKKKFSLAKTSTGNVKLKSWRTVKGLIALYSKILTAMLS